MTCHNFRFLLFAIFLALILNLVYGEQSTRDRIQKHRAWLNQRTHERQLIGYVETSDPYQKIKYFKKLIKFKNKHDQKENEVFFVPHSHKTDNNSYDDHSKISHPMRNLSSIDSGKKYSYDVVKNIAETNQAEKHLENNVLNDILERNKKIVNETIEKQISSVNVINTSTRIGKEQDGNKIHNDVDIHNNRVHTDTINSLKISKKFLNDSFNDFEIQKFINEHVKYNTYNNITIKKIWSKWNSWSDCSRTCGDGIKSQSRECMLKMYHDGKKVNSTSIPLNECIGIYKRYRICNERECPTMSEDFRQQQCSLFNNQSFRGKTYEWEPYIKDGSECELNCKPKSNSKYFARLREHVIDGTECKINSKQSNEEYDKAICIEGKCKNVINLIIYYALSEFMHLITALSLLITIACINSLK